jgi:hypothetical protein
MDATTASTMTMRNSREGPERLFGVVEEYTGSNCQGRDDNNQDWCHHTNTLTDNELRFLMY